MNPPLIDDDMSEVTSQVNIETDAEEELCRSHADSTSKMVEFHRKFRREMRDIDKEK